MKVRKIQKIIETIYIEGNKVASTPLNFVAVAAVIENPWKDEQFTEDLKPKILEIAPKLGDLMVGSLIELIGDKKAVQAYGKAAVVGENGEIEHGSGIIHQLRFGNKFRDAVNGTSYLSFTNKRGGMGTSISLPMMHIQDGGLREFYHTFEFHIPDAPRSDEIVIAIGIADGGRPHARIGNRYIDMEEMKNE